ncbi:Branched-chain-amino-acid aminotransferase [Brevundimonas diminuta]|jgi:branched-chain amino acid aminotransferase|uniref:branched-chain amino acid aminotransferase n=1 Tax=Brevundimonas diminuta TaxID=293 RepID=UPI000207EE15|nr:branched-chain amino acid aminotransferase [Brevundimonas diminuta]EGF96241.1 branched-chain amino acid aminotransferase [Brevundimonas diminuta ATCC 11568]OWR19026.1 branched-chain amino acid aminotransferase [Brevundimonas diminuta]WQE44226.1 branched-chain amino acid aminotransferase [Brevundimonas diminuta]SPU43676.1 Branched-chain-amino-acid aminotransferase [Brevundimonas diminuta]SUW16732.1 Branched-chain-amino-acid aminotransferase [Brevundimonas diminuta]
MAFVPFDDRDGWIWFDGEFVPWREAKTHVLTHGLHYGSSVFEGERMYGGEIFKLTAHSERLKRSAELLDFEIPYSVAEIDAACKETCARNGLIDCYIRPVAYLGPEQLSVTAKNSKVHLAIAAWEWPSYFDPEVKKKGIALEWAKWRRPDPATAPSTAKAAGLYMICTMSKTAAEKRGFADALMLDWRGYVAEATGANVFFVRNGVLHTPRVDHILNGITRQTVIEMAQARGIEVIVRDILPEELGDFSECFLTGSAAEVTPVGQVGDYRFTPGALSLSLMDDYGKLVRRTL